MALTVVVDLWVHTYSETYQVVYIKYVQLFPCQLYLNKMV